jgi:hypothetical protein
MSVDMTDKIVHDSLEAHYAEGSSGKRPKIFLRIDVDDPALLQGVDVEEDLRETVRAVAKKKKGAMQSDVGIEVLVNGAYSARKRDGV